MKSAALTGFLRVLYGAGKVPPPDPGARDIAPGNPPVQAGNWQFIQPVFFSDAGLQSPDRIGVVPPMYRDWPDYQVNQAGLSGQLGGGTATQGDGVPLSMEDQDTLFFNPSNQLLYNVPDFQIMVPDDSEEPPV
jgi:hypothetical protein